MVCEYGALCVAGGSVLGCSVRLNCANAVSAETSSSPRITSPRTSARIGLRMGHASRNMDGMRRNVPPALRVNFPHGEPRLLWLMVRKKAGMEPDMAAIFFAFCARAVSACLQSVLGAVAHECAAVE